MRTKSACAVLAWAVLLTLAVAGLGMRGPSSPAQVAARTAASTTHVTPASTLTVAVSPAAAGDHAPGYVVRPGDTLSGIAAALGTPGGWPALYAANRRLIGPNPGLIQPGMMLVLPGPRPTRYTVAAGDTLSGIATALGVPGGWPTLYAANRRVIGPNPGLIQPGTILTITRPGAPAVTRHPARAPAAHPVVPARHPHPAPPAPARHRPAPTSTQAAGMPGWLRTMLIAVGLLIGAAFLAELVPAITRRRRPASTQSARPPTAVLNEKAGPGSLPGEEARIVMADYDRLVVTHNKADGVVYVLRPPGEDPRAILRVARLVLAEDPYEKLADRLGVPASWPME